MRSWRVDLGTEFLADERIMRIPSEFVVKDLTGRDDDRLEYITSHKEDDQVPNADMSPRVEHGRGRNSRGGRCHDCRHGERQSVQYGDGSKCVYAVVPKPLSLRSLFLNA